MPSLILTSFAPFEHSSLMQSRVRALHLFLVPLNTRYVCLLDFCWEAHVWRIWYLIPDMT